MKSKETEEIALCAEIMKQGKRLARVLQKYEQAKTADRQRTLALLIEDILMNIGWNLFDCGDYERGLAAYQAMSWDIYGEYKYKGICTALINMERYDEAKQLLERGLQRFPESHMLLFSQGIAHRQLGYYVDALKYFDRALKCSPGYRTGLFAKAMTLSELGYYEASLAIVRKLMKKDPDDPKYLCEAGYCTLMMGYPEDAVEYFKQALGRGYLSPNLYGGLVSAYLEMGLSHYALEVAQEGITEFPDEPGMYENLGECYFEYGWIDDAKAVLTDGIKKFPEDERLKEFLKKIGDETDDPDKGKTPPPIGLVILLIVLLRILKEKHAG
jgi:tetratricopeptide (TPR) repeat protein